LLSVLGLSLFLLTVALLSVLELSVFLLTVVLLSVLGLSVFLLTVGVVVLSLAGVLCTLLVGVAVRSVERLPGVVLI
jgi:hypothetical protein